MRTQISRFVKNPQNLDLGVQFRLFRWRDLSCHQLLYSGHLRPHISSTLLLYLLHDLDVDGSLGIVFVLSFCQLFCLCEIVILEALHEFLGHLIHVKNGAAIWHLDSFHAQPRHEILRSHVRSKRRLPGTILLIIPRSRLLCIWIRKALEPDRWLSCPFLEEKVHRELICSDFEPFLQVLVFLITVLLHGNLADEEVLDVIRQLAELFEGLLLITIRVSLVDLCQQCQARNAQHLVEGHVIQFHGTLSGLRHRQHPGTQQQNDGAVQ
mmetsp:Transcript_124750/g.233323  ORF Transcript_124750/g.233323 Transcript_124750/m.233323 type:complete len:267 (+) Transcript_124750:107-907(+)